MILMSALCATECAAAVPEYSSDSCNPQRLKGGIVQMIITSCDLDWTDENIQDQSFWETAIAAGKIVFTGRVKGGGFDVNESTEDTDACLTPEVTGRTWSLTVKDYNVDLSGGLDVEFYNALVEGRGKYQAFARTSQDYLFGALAVTVGVKPTMPDTCDQLFFREVKFTWKDLSEPNRVYVPFLSTLNPTSIIS